MSEKDLTEQKMKEAQALAKIHHEYQKAEEMLLSIVKEYPDDAKGWYVLLSTCTCVFNPVEYLIASHCERLPERFSSYYERAYETASDRKKPLIKKRWEFFSEHYGELYESCMEQKRKYKEELNPSDSETESYAGASGSNDDGCWIVLLFILLFLFFLPALLKIAGIGAAG